MFLWPAQLLARITLQKKKAKEALELFDRVIRIKPDDASAHCNRANILTEMLRHEDALASYNLAIAIIPDSCFFVGLENLPQIKLAPICFLPYI